MRKHSNRIRRGLTIEWLEGRDAPSRGATLHAALESLHHHAHGHEHRGRVHEVSTAHNGGQGKDDAANHNANDTSTAHVSDDPANHDQNGNPGGHGKDDAANHDANDTSGNLVSDDPANHDQNDDSTVTATGSDDPPGHDHQDRHDGHGHDDGSGHH